MKAKDVLQEAIEALDFRAKIGNLANSNRTISEHDLQTITRICEERNTLISMILKDTPLGDPFEDRRERYARALQRLELLINREW